MNEPPALEDLVDLLRRCLATSDAIERQSLIQQFQGPVWGNPPLTGDDRIDDVLATAAYDLDYYEPRDEWRAQDRSFFDDDELDRLLRSILRDLGQPEGLDA